MTPTGGECFCQLLMNIYYVTVVTHLLPTHDWECCLACHSSSVEELEQWVDSQKAGVGLLLVVEVQEVKADLLMRENFGSTIIKGGNNIVLYSKDTP